MDIIQFSNNLLGVYATELNMWHLIARSLVVYILGILLCRLNRRFIGMRTTSNFFLFIFIGSLLANAIVGPLFYEILGMAIFIMFTNWLVVVAGYYVKNFRIMVQGKAIVLIQDGKIIREGLRKCFITEEELIALLRFQTNTADLSKVKEAYFEDSGQISFVFYS